MATATQPKAVTMATPPKFRASQYLTLGLGLATFKVGLAPLATDKSNVGANYICEEHRVKVQQRWWCEAGGHYVEREVGGEKVYQPIKGYPFGDQYVILDEQTMSEIAIPKQDTLAFDRWDDHLDPVWVDKTYLVRPDDTLASERVYDAIAAAMIQHGFILFGATCIGKTTHNMALRWSSDLGCLVLHQLHLASRMKLHEAANLSTAIANRDRPANKLVEEVRKTVRRVADKGADHDTPDFASEALLAAIEDVATGGMLSDNLKKKTVEEPEVIDLMAALRASVEETQKSKRGETKQARPRKKAAAPKGGKKK